VSAALSAVGEVNDVVAAAWSAAEVTGGRLAGVSLALLFAGLAFHALKVLARSRAWQNVLRASLPETPVAFRDAAVPMLAGAGAGGIVPFGGGEVLRVVLARARLRGARGRGGPPTATIVGTLAVERALDLLVSAAVVATALTVGLLPNGALHGRVVSVGAPAGDPLLAGLVAGGVVLGAALATWRWRRRATSAVAAVLRGLVVFSQPSRYLCSVASWQLLAWTFRVAALVLFLQAFHVPGTLAVAPVVLSVQLLASSVPVTPGGAGTQQALLAAALGSGAIVGFSAGAQAATVVFDLFLGLAALVCCGIRPRLSLLRPAASTA
jgi:uncharacterized membrane protein YbhN (UPF0104 family)